MKKRTLLSLSIISTMTLLTLTSCKNNNDTAATSDELMTMVNNGESIEIEIAEPINQEQGTLSTVTWEELASIKENETLRKEWDNTLGIQAIENGKNGMLYVDANGNQTNNNTLYVALHNEYFQKALKDGSTEYNGLIFATEANYADIELASDDDKETALLMAINGYFNLLPDNTPNYSNPDSTIERNEFMAMLFRANTPVQELKENTSFTNAVGQNDYNLYAQGAVDSSYLDLASKSLDNLTYNGTITRAEAIYAIVNTYFKDEYKNADINKKLSYTDCKNGGDIAQKVADKKKSSLSEVDHWKSYELTYVLQNANLGMPTDLYKAMVVAEEKGLIDGTISRWDEGLTKSEAVDLIVRAIQKDDSMANFNNLRAEIGEQTGSLENTDNENKGTVTVDSASADIPFAEGEERGEDLSTVEESTEPAETIQKAPFTVDDFDYSGYSALFDTEEEKKDFLQMYIDDYEAGKIDYIELLGGLANVGIDNTELYEDYKKSQGTSSSSTTNTQQSQQSQQQPDNPSGNWIVPGTPAETLERDWDNNHPELSDVHAY